MVKKQHCWTTAKRAWWLLSSWVGLPVDCWAGIEKAQNPVKGFGLNRGWQLSTVLIIYTSIFY
jgi:hypothetical protein